MLKHPLDQAGLARDKGAGQYTSEGDLIQSGNYRITEFQAAVLVEQLKRVPGQVALRDKNAIHLNQLLAEIPGVASLRVSVNA